MRLGVYVSRHLSFAFIRKAVWGNAMVANRTREIRLCGMKRGACGNVNKLGLVRIKDRVYGNPGEQNPTCDR